MRTRRRRTPPRSGHSPIGRRTHTTEGLFPWNRQVAPTHDKRPVLVLMRSNRQSPAREISLRSFREAVLAKVVADVKMSDTNLSL